ncbi:uncharacterized protein B0H18DRAFT_966859 [Fomitopsis serialis]|uniref:uncharacterized protein n=1 Tax=Fomitopsis serialis TaxID=139415 RepID=UPI002008835B|nr:uncharacterized protein B0H18DRAFT_966859 [Neoantrodia serialis]KAH9938380.1 hypothetical protein B0H18DRAFT_966859 [Neoantrodia serialis]
MCPAPISLSILDRELQALDDDDRGLLYAVHSQDLSTHRGQDEQDSQFGALPEAHEWYDQSECVEWQEGPVDSVMAEADTEATWHPDFIDDELGRLDDWQEAFNAQIGLEDAALSYWDGEPAEEERPESYACDQELYEDEEESSDILQGPSRPQTTSSWCSATSEQAMSYSPSAIASEVSTELLVPQFAQGQDVARSLRGHWLPQRS